MPNFSFNKKQIKNNEQEININNDDWYNIPGYNYYKITKDGKVRRISNFITDINGKTFYRKGKILKQKINKQGYISLTLTENGKPKGEFIHVLLAKTFISNPNNLPIINHIDENPSNNSLDNLEWCNYSYNAKHSIDTINKAHDKERKIVYRINPKTNEIKKYLGVRIAAKENNTNHSNIKTAVVSGGICAGYKWKYNLNDIIEKEIPIYCAKDIINNKVIICNTPIKLCNKINITRKQYYNWVDKNRLINNKYYVYRSSKKIKL